VFDYTDWRSLLFSWDGRLRRSHFWGGMAALVVAQILLGWIPLVGALLSLALAIPGASFGVRRLHDMGRTGWLALAPVVGVVVTGVLSLIIGAFSTAAVLGGGNAAFGALALAGPAFLVTGLVALVNLAFVLWVGLTPGVAGDNRFGPDPRQTLIKGVSAPGV
jgi:uncharacterized membrane protein YhaH (DUF805 family)